MNTRKKGQWTRDEDVLLINSVKHSRMDYDYLKPEIEELHKKYEGKSINWKQVETHFKGTRTQAQCRQRYLNYLSPSIRRGSFSVEEDKAIMQMFDKFGSKWSKFREETILTGRTVFAIRSRYRALTKTYKPCMKRSRFSTKLQEDMLAIVNSTGALSERQIKLLKKFVSQQEQKQNTKRSLENPEMSMKSPTIKDEKLNDAVDGIILLQAKFCSS